MRKSRRWAFVMGLLCWLRNAFNKFGLTRCAGANARRRVTVRWRSATLCGNRPQPERRASGAEWQDGNAISQASNASFGICADIIARVCANLLPGRLRARGQSVREHGSAVDQMRSHRLRRGFSKAVRRVLRPYARAPKKRGARPPAAHSAYLRGRTSDPPALSQPGPRHRWKNGDRGLY